MSIYVYIHVGAWMRGCFDWLCVVRASVCLHAAMCIICVNNSFTSSSINGDGQIKLRRPLRMQFNII